MAFTPPPSQPVATPAPRPRIAAARLAGTAALPWLLAACVSVPVNQAPSPAPAPRPGAAGAPVPPRPTPPAPSPSPSPPATPPAPATPPPRPAATGPRCSGPALVGIIDVEGPNAFINGRPARDGDLVCEGDSVTTGAGSSAVVRLPGAEGDRGGDFVQLDANTDPRFSWLPNARCLKVDDMKYGQLLVRSGGRAPCLVLRTADATLYAQSGLSNYRVVPASAGSASRTEITSTTGAVYRLQPGLSNQQLASANLGQLQGLVRAAQPPMSSTVLQAGVLKEQRAVMVPPGRQLPPSINWNLQFRKLNSVTLTTRPAIQIPR